ncbi:(2Fe-2S) ferredoxin domain-containing protein [Methylocystis sp. B8]|uniref:(2Fe-2S) ferredoxin domain-containing protein n=1 Tax=Methylocystis sp. B8 TaxID=544938 RepID=UPI001FEF0197|nr:(2Fe-2S) ferredoxin domain-containing protein [Methylocystis sp. B8]
MNALPVRLLVCVGPCCDAEGKGRALLASAEMVFTQTFPQELSSGQLVIATRDCLRLCTRDPVVRFEPSGDALSNPSLDDILKLARAALAEQACPTRFGSAKS